MNTLPFIRSQIKRAERIHKAQLTATACGTKYHSQSVLNANSAARKEKYKRLHVAQLMAF